MKTIKYIFLTLGLLIFCNQLYAQKRKIPKYGSEYGDKEFISILDKDFKFSLELTKMEFINPKKFKPYFNRDLVTGDLYKNGQYILKIGGGKMLSNPDSTLFICFNNFIFIPLDKKEISLEDRDSNLKTWRSTLKRKQTQLTTPFKTYSLIQLRDRNADVGGVFELKNTGIEAEGGYHVYKIELYRNLYRGEFTIAYLYRNTSLKKATKAFEKIGIIAKYE